MLMKVFEFFPHESTTPFTIVAKDDEEAHAIYGDWILYHDMRRDPAPKRVIRHSPDWLAKRPQLAEAVARRVSGIAYWVSHDAGWVIASPNEAPAGKLAPPEAPVRYYLVEAESDNDSDAMVFAPSAEKATTLYVVWHKHTFGRLPQAFAIGLTSRWLLMGALTQLREEMDAGMVGVAGWTRERGWRVYPADHDWE